MLLCTVRNCGLPLELQASRRVCPRGHSFDVARSGYLNLLQPQDRRSNTPGDSAHAVGARRRIHDRGITHPLAHAIVGFVSPGPDDMVLDAGCGDGFYLNAIEESSGCTASGVDISIPAIDAAAKRYKRCQWVVANADRFIPWSDGAFSLVTSITGRMNPTEFRRILRTDGRLLVAVAASDDLIELRGAGRDRVERTVEEFSGLFRLVDQQRATTVADLDTAAVEDVLLAIYRPLQNEPARDSKVTFSLDLMLFRAK
jgi:23S rRNA (guanine745-N1)-methyltransferase